jgi:hypothetical protein
VAASAAAALVVALAVYPALRLVDGALFPQTNPAAIVAASESAFALRVVVALHLGALAAFGAFAWATRAPRAFAVALARAIPLAAALLAAQAVLRP